MHCHFCAQAFDDCTTIGSTFKLLDSFEGLLDREVIAHDLEKKHTDLLQAYARDLKDVADLFHQYKDRPIVAKNSAPYSGEQQGWRVACQSSVLQRCHACVRR